MSDFNPKAIAALAQEFEKGSRVLILHGREKEEDGFYIHPTRLSDKDILLVKGSISREITVAEAIQLADSKFCQNKPTVVEFLLAINAL